MHRKYKISGNHVFIFCNFKTCSCIIPGNDGQRYDKPEPGITINTGKKKK